MTQETWIEDFKLPCDLRVQFSHGTYMDEEPSVIIEKVEVVFQNVTIVGGKRHVNDISMDITHFIHEEEEWAIVDHVLENEL